MLHRDTAGQERYASLAPLYYRGAAAAAVVYDISSGETFAKAQHWVKELQKNAGDDIGAPAGLCNWSSGAVRVQPARLGRGGHSVSMPQKEPCDSVSLPSAPQPEP